MVRVVRSPFGAVLGAMRENEQRAIALGFRVDRYKLMAFVLSGTLAGLAGVLFAIGNRLSGLDGVDWHTSGKVVMMSILGGIGTIFGPIVGAGHLPVARHYFDLEDRPDFGDKTNIVMGTIFALCVLLFRRGIVGELLATRSKPQPEARGARPSRRRRCFSRRSGGAAVHGWTTRFPGRCRRCARCARCVSPRR